MSYNTVLAWLSCWSYNTVLAWLSCWSYNTVLASLSCWSYNTVLASLSCWSYNTVLASLQCFSHRKLHHAAMFLCPDGFVSVVSKLLKRGQGKQATGNYSSLFTGRGPAVLTVIIRHLAVCIQSAARAASVSSADAGWLSSSRAILVYSSEAGRRYTSNQKPVTNVFNLGLALWANGQRQGLDDMYACTDYGRDWKTCPPARTTTGTGRHVCLHGLRQGLEDLSACTNYGRDWKTCTPARTTAGTGRHVCLHGLRQGLEDMYA